MNYKYAFYILLIVVCCLGATYSNISPIRRVCGDPIVCRIDDESGKTIMCIPVWYEFDLTENTNKSVYHGFHLEDCKGERVPTESMKDKLQQQTP